MNHFKSRTTCIDITTKCFKEEACLRFFLSKIPIFCSHLLIILWHTHNCYWFSRYHLLIPYEIGSMILITISEIKLNCQSYSLHILIIGIPLFPFFNIVEYLSWNLILYVNRGWIRYSQFKILFVYSEVNSENQQDVMPGNAYSISAMNIQQHTIKLFWMYLYKYAKCLQINLIFPLRSIFMHD